MRAVQYNHWSPGVSAAPTPPVRIVVVGGGFAGVYAAMELEQAFGRGSNVEITLINKDNFFLFTPMLHEVAASDLDITHIVNPIRKLLKRASFFHGEILNIDFVQKQVKVAHGVDREHPHEIPWDHLVLALGSVTNFYNLPGVAARSLTMKSLGDAIGLRNRMIENLEEADFECCPVTRERMLTFVVAGGGFAGIETAAGINDFLHSAMQFYPNLQQRAARLVVVHSGSTILPELDNKLGSYAIDNLTKRGVEFKLNTRVLGFDDEGVRLSDGTVIPTRTLVWTAGTSANPLLAALPCAKERGRVIVNEFLEVPGFPGVWALGDCACVPDLLTKGTCPPTAQHALREARTVARNIAATIHGRPRKPFVFRTLGQLASLGRRTGVANILGIQVTGFVAWWLWRTIYLSKLPRLERKIRVAIDWTCDLIFTKDLVHIPTNAGLQRHERARSAVHPAAAAV